MNKKQLRQWYEDNVGEFDSEQGDVIENLIDNYNPVIGSEDHKQSSEDALEYIRKEITEKYNNHEELVVDLENDFNEMCVEFKYKSDMVQYQIAKHEVDMQNKISEILNEQENIVREYPKKPKKPKKKKPSESEADTSSAMNVLRIPENIIPPEVLKSISKIMGESKISISPNKQIQAPPGEIGDNQKE